MDFIFLQTFASATPIASYQQPTTNSEVNTIQVQGSIFCPLYSSPLPQSSMLHLCRFYSCIHHFYHYPHWSTGTSYCHCRLNLRSPFRLVDKTKKISCANARALARLADVRFNISSLKQIPIPHWNGILLSSG